MSGRLVIRKDTIILLIISIFLLYMLWFQYAVTENSIVMPLCAVLMGAYVVTRRNRLFFYRYLTPVFLFFFCGFLSSVVFDDTSTGISLLVNMLKYSIPMIAIYTYVGQDGKKLERILWVTSFTCALVALSTLINGTVTVTGAVTLGSLNSNVLSTYLMLGLISNLQLLMRNTTQWGKRLLTFFVIVEAAAQIVAASRRGILVFAFLCGMYVFLKVTTQPLTKNTFLKYILIAFLLMVVGLLFADKFLAKVSNAVFFQRFLGRPETLAGDRLRASYQQVAKDLFFSSPFLGKGLGAVARCAGIYSHSLFYETLACTGLAGMACILSFFYRNTSACLRMCKKCRNPLLKSAVRMTLCIVAAILITGVAVVLIYDSVFYVLLAIVCINVNVEEKEVLEGIS